MVVKGIGNNYQRIDPEIIINCPKDKGIREWEKLKWRVS